MEIGRLFPAGRAQTGIGTGRAAEVRARARKGEDMAKYDWGKISLEYITGTESLAELAERLNIPMGTIRKHAQAEGWNRKRESQRKRVEKKALDRDAARKAKVLDRLTRSAERLIRTFDRYIQDDPTIHNQSYMSGGMLYEKRLNMANTKAIRNLSGTLRDAAAVIEFLTQGEREHEADKEERSVIIIPDRERIEE